MIFLRLYTKGDVKLRDENNKLRIDVKRRQIFVIKSNNFGSIYGRMDWLLV